MMKPLVVDKVASVATGANLGREVRISDEIPCEEGVLVAVRVNNNKSSYNQIELTSGRMAQLKAGDVLVGALGHRHALFGYSGHLPATVAPGDMLNILNLGGVLGICDSVNPDRGQPFECDVLGGVLHFPFLGERIGRPARVGVTALDPGLAMESHGIPVVALAGTCMDSGKTAAACAIIGRFVHHGLRVGAFKATGVSLRRDVLAMEDAGARHTGIFTDFGVVTTTESNAPALARALLTQLAAHRPDVIVFELGDGLLGAYGVQAILSDPDIRGALSAVVLCANDPVAAWGGVTLLRDRYGIEPAAVTGRATDNTVGSDMIREQLGVPAHNALTEESALAEVLIGRLFPDLLVGERPS
jgi:hypothetical protein